MRKIKQKHQQSSKITADHNILLHTKQKYNTRLETFYYRAFSLCN